MCKIFIARIRLDEIGLIMSLFEFKMSKRKQQPFHYLHLQHEGYVKGKLMPAQCVRFNTK